ncbi:transporter [Shewanella abyssi]|uniref:SphA family protein n=1 Tax=Shewanella abyssi TaxID=311789 RepID=UPI00200E4E11|nr:transporter [Shewanella abyssi]MCL1051674.1 transporter [Shewanella abyssi]
MHSKLYKKNRTGLLLGIGLIGLFANYANATEGGGGIYPNGAEGMMAGAVPPPGFYYLNYATHYSANGDEMGADLQVNATANVSRFVYVTEKKLFGADYGVYFVAPLLHVSAALDTHSPAGTISNSDNGLGDISFSPFMLSWHSKNLHTGVALEFSAPTGDFDKNSIANLGRNYWTVEPVFVATYITDSGLELSGKFMYDFNSENSDTDYKSGQEFHFDYAMAYHHGPWAFGIGGYFYQQTTKDTGAGVTDPDGNKGRVFAIGPSMKYDLEGLSIEVKYQEEMWVKNRTEGDKVWLKMVMPL